jgi:polar amino acid transport system permease protein
MLEDLLYHAEDFFTAETGRYFLRAMGMTLALTVVGCGFGLAFGLVLGTARMVRNHWFVPLRLLVILYVEAFRRIPFLVLLMGTLLVIKSLGVDISLFAIAAIAIVIFSTAYLSEIVRAGLESVHRAQIDAAVAMNFGWFATMRHVVFPQAWRVIVPPAFAFFVMFVKDTSYAAQVGVYELLQVGKYFNQIGKPAVLSFGSILVLYFILSYPLTRLGWWIEAKLKARGQPVAKPTIGI